MTFHSLRRTYASLLAEAGADSAYTMKQIGHSSAKLTLEVYTDVGNRRHGANEQVGTLLRGPEVAFVGTGTSTGGEQTTVDGQDTRVETGSFQG